MTRQYIPKIKDLSKERVAELKAFCYQYPEWIDRQNESDLIKIDMVESSASEATYGEIIIIDYLIKNVTDKDSTVESLIIGLMPIGREQFREYKRNFFSILNDKQNIIYSK